MSLVNVPEDSDYLMFDSKEEMMGFLEMVVERNPKSAFYLPVLNSKAKVLYFYSHKILCFVKGEKHE